ncbi:uncharacterized protein V6R79_011593 [Siganus canaliculatus]
MLAVQRAGPERYGRPDQQRQEQHPVRTDTVCSCTFLPLNDRTTCNVTTSETKLSLSLNLNVQPLDSQTDPSQESQVERTVTYLPHPIGFVKTVGRDGGKCAEKGPPSDVTVTFVT